MKLCLGTVQFGMDYGVQGANKQPYKNIDEIIKYAIKSGIREFDSAAAYGEAEDVLGHYIKHEQYGANKIRVVSKLAADVFESISEEQWSKAAIKNAKKSIESLGIHVLDAYLFHNAEKLYDKKAVEALYSVKEAGFAKMVGVSVYSPEEAMKALEYKAIQAIQIPYNVFDHRLDKVGFFQKAKDQGLTVYARSTLLQGLLMMDVTELPKKMIFAKKYLRDYRDICDKYQITPLKASVGYVGGHQGIDYIVFGVDSLEQLKEYLAIQDSVLPDEMINELCNRFGEVEERLINPTMW